MTTQNGPIAGSRPVIYQLLPRLFTNTVEHPVPNGPINVNGSGKMNDITNTVLKSIKNLGATHVWYTGVIEHAHCSDYTRYGILRDNPHVVKGKAGSPYAIKDYYDIDPDIAVNVPERMTEFEALIERTHTAGLKFIMDFVPNHVARQYHSDAAPKGVPDLGASDNTDMFFSPGNNFYYIPRQIFAPSVPLGEGKDRYVEFPAKCTGNDCFTAFPGPNDWYETVKLNYGYDPGDHTCHFSPVPDTWYKMLHILLFWASKGIDGFRCDMVHMVPLEFWQWAIPQVKHAYPRISFIAEIYDTALYRPYIQRGGFDYLYDKVTLYDTLRGIVCGDISASQLTSCWQTVEGISGNMLSFLENHDEQRYASRQYAGTPYNVLPSLVAISTLSRGAVMVYMGQELGEPGADAEGFSGTDGRTTIFDYWSLDTLRRWYCNGKANGAQLTDTEKELRSLYSRVLQIVNSENAVREGSFFDLQYANYHNESYNPHRHFSYLLNHGNETILVVLNFEDKDSVINVNIPVHAFETLNIPELYDSEEAVELITGKTHHMKLTSAEPTTVGVDKWGAVMLKLNH